MKARWMLPLFFVGVLALAGGMATPARADVSFDFFYSNLAPSGSWLVSAQYGRVWQPAIYRPDWNPYFDGHWVYTDVGWMWDSDYEWGDVCYHYGTWVDDDEFGWVWVPGYVWAPSWVDFRTCPGYIGWSPVLPGFEVGLFFDFDRFPEHCVFVRDHDFLDRDLRFAALPKRMDRDLFDRSNPLRHSLAVENGFVVNHGPSVTSVESFTGRRIAPVRFDRVPGAAPRALLARDQLRVSPDMRRAGLRAAEPISARTPLPQGNERGFATRREPTGTMMRPENRRATPMERGRGGEYSGRPPAYRGENGGRAPSYRGEHRSTAHQQQDSRSPNTGYERYGRAPNGGSERYGYAPNSRSSRTITQRAAPSRGGTASGPSRGMSQRPASRGQATRSAPARNGGNAARGRG